MIELTSKVKEEAAKVGIHINADETKLRMVGKCGTSHIVNA